MSKHRKNRNKRPPSTLAGCIYVYFDLIKSYIKTRSSTTKEKLKEFTEIVDSKYQKEFYNGK